MAVINREQCDLSALLKADNEDSDSINDHMLEISNNKQRRLNW